MYSAFYLTDRYDNSIVYVTPEYNGFQGSFMYSNGREGDENKWSYNQHYYGAGLTYGNGPLNFDLIYEALDYKGKEDKNKTTQLLNLVLLMISVLSNCTVHMNTLFMLPCPDS